MAIETTLTPFDFGGTMEEVITSEEFSLQQAREILEKDTIAVLGYGVQGPGQALNLRDNGIRVIVGQREGGSQGIGPGKGGVGKQKTLVGAEGQARE